MTLTIEEAVEVEAGEMELIDTHDAIVELEDDKGDEEQIVQAGEQEIQIEEPPVVQLSFAERVSSLVDAMAFAEQEFCTPEPENMTVIDYYDRAHGGQGYLGKLYLNADTGAEYKLVKWDGQTVMLG